MEPNSSFNRYDVSGNVEAQYVDAAQTVLRNKLGITDLETLQIREEEGLAQAYESLLGEVRLDTPLTCELLRHKSRGSFWRFPPSARGMPGR